MYELVLTRTLQHFTIPHCTTMLYHATVSSESQRDREEAHMFSMPEADDIPPSSKNHGLKPSDDFAEIILQCCERKSVAHFSMVRSHSRVPAADTRPLCRRT